MSYLDELKHKILANKVLDPEDIHHEFVSGIHGRKLDFDSIPTGSELYEEWIDACAQFIRENYKGQPDMIVGVANGANRMAVSIASRLANRTYGLITEKLTPTSVGLARVSQDFISSYKPAFVLIVEDVGTAGTTSATAAAEALKAGAKKVSVLNTWQRRERLERLEQAGVDYHSMIKEFLPTYEPDACTYCKKGIKLVAHV